MKYYTEVVGYRAVQDAAVSEGQAEVPGPAVGTAG